MVIPYVLLSLIAVSSTRRRKARPSGSSGVSIADQPSTELGQQNRPGDSRPVSNRRRRNCARCVSR